MQAHRALRTLQGLSDSYSGSHHHHLRAFSDLLPDALQPSSPMVDRASEEHDFNMSHVVLKSPFATLRSMGAVTTSQTSGIVTTTAAHGHGAISLGQQDPIVAGVLTLIEAKTAVELYYIRAVFAIWLR